MELTQQMKEVLVASLKNQRDEIDQLIKSLEGPEGVALVPATTVSGPSMAAIVTLPEGLPGRKPHPWAGKKPGRPSKRVIKEDDDQDFGKCTIDAIAAILRSGVDGSHELTAADIMSELKHRWKIIASFKTVSNVLGRGKSGGRFEPVGEGWRLGE